ncbi:MAG: proline--tRNA ligase [Candidatus Omnitrophota bacterium]|nr:proline--tRNA ligase [Candidatus Omnitrophota bacterium]
MYWSKTFIPTLKEDPQEAEIISHKLLLRSGLIRMLMAGAYSYLPLGYRVLNNIQRIIRQEMNSSDAAELLLPALQPQELWQESGRDKTMDKVMVRFSDRRGRKLCLGPTHEEVITALVRSCVSSYKQLPLILYQLQTKFRDEIRPRFGLIRSCEFIMKDAYSFDKDEAGLDKNYQLMSYAYQRIFKRCGLNFLVTEADSGVMGGSCSHEFMIPAKDGEDAVLLCPKCKTARAKGECKDDTCVKCGVLLDEINAIEIGHIFKLGVKYSEVLGAKFLDNDRKLKSIIMGCYGIGVSRLVSAIIEQNYDTAGIIWPKEIAPYEIIILPLDVTEGRIMSSVIEIYKELTQNGINVLLDDRDERAGVKFKDADLLGIPLQLIIGKEFLKSNTCELKIRSSGERIIKPREEIIDYIQNPLSSVIQ